eukprot:COSAG02_NODE_26_length_51927_cov_61.213881_4_plen_110_part_00
MIVAALAAVVVVTSATSVGVMDDSDVECAWRKLAVEFAVEQLGPHVAVPVQEVLAGSISGDLPVNRRRDRILSVILSHCANSLIYTVLHLSYPLICKNCDLRGRSRITD